MVGTVAGFWLECSDDTHCNMEMNKNNKVPLLRDIGQLGFAAIALNGVTGSFERISHLTGGY